MGGLLARNSGRLAQPGHAAHRGPRKENAMQFQHPEAIVGTEWLATHLRDPTLRIFDCTTYLLYETGTGRPYRVESGRSDYDAGHIPNSGFLDLQGELSDTTSRFN